MVSRVIPSLYYAVSIDIPKVSTARGDGCQGVRGPVPCQSMAAPETAWLNPWGNPLLASGDVHVWLVAAGAPDIPHAHLESLVSPAEQSLCARMVRPVDKRRFIAVRAALRAILGRYFETPPSSISIAYSKSGKPFCENQAGDRGALHFNVSHAGDVAVIAVSRGLRVGIDVERMREMKSRDDILESFFSAEERAWVHSCPEEAQMDAFFRVWTRREAASKAVGTGLLKAFTLFSVPAAPLSSTGFSLRLPISAEETGREQQWWMRDLDPLPDHAGALCVEKKSPAPSCWRFAW